ncbi:MAG: hypothetical protein V3R16_10735 [Nitrospirales bacterium]
MVKKKLPTQDANQNKGPSPLETVTDGIKVLRERVAEIEDIRGDGFPYRDAMQARIERQIRDTILQVFGEGSPVFQQYVDYHLGGTSDSDLAEAIELLGDLVLLLEDKRLALLGTPRGDTPESPTGTISRSQTRNPSARPTPQPKGGTISLPPGAGPTGRKEIPQPTVPHEPLAFSPTADHLPAGPAIAQPQRQTPFESGEEAGSGLIRGTQPAGRPDSPLPPPPRQPPDTEALHNTATDRVAPSSPQPAGQQSGLESAVGRLRRLSERFHLVTRQLRLRGEYRDTIHVEDQQDVQDLFHALLCLEFEDIEADEWGPSEARETRQITFFVEQGQIGITLKKTKPGQGRTEITNELGLVAQQHSSHLTCKLLFCFIYDPEGRIGNPRGLERDLMKSTQPMHLEVVVAPK